MPPRPMSQRPREGRNERRMGDRPPECRTAGPAGVERGLLAPEGELLLAYFGGH